VTRAVPRAAQARIQSAATLAAGLGAASLGAAALGAASWIAYSRRVVDHGLPLPNALPAERRSVIAPRSGQLSYYADAQAAGRPLLLIHSINAAASAYEMRPLFEQFRGSRPVIALDLPGFGFSERSERAYSPELYKHAILEALDVTAGGAPVDAVALSLGCEFLALAALAEPQRFHSLAFISPSGLRERGRGRPTQQANDAGASQSVHRALSFPLWGQAVFDLIATRKSIGFFLSQSFTGPVDPGLAEYAYLTSHQWGAHHAPLHFVSGLLFTQDVATRAYEQLSVPALVLRDRDAFTSFELLPRVLQRNPRWQEQPIKPTLGLPQFEKPRETAQALEAFWRGL
jgi:pimeloyl-ACP methyl ester carboxylesterase